MIACTCSCPGCRIPDYWPRLTDIQWAVLAQLLPRATGPGGEATRLQVAGMIYALYTGLQWRLLPPQFGDPHRVEMRFHRWAEAAVFRNAYHALYPPAALADGRIVVIDGSYSKCHRSASGARKNRTGARCELWCPQECPAKRPWNCPDNQAMGMTRGGRNTNTVIAVNEDRQLVNWTLLAGNAKEWQADMILLKGIKPKVVVADDVHDNNELRGYLANRRIEGAIPNHPRRTVNRFRRHWAIRLQHLADNYFADLKNFRRVATRYEKTATAFDAVIALAALVIALRQDYPG